MLTGYWIELKQEGRRLDYWGLQFQISQKMIIKIGSGYSCFFHFEFYGKQFLQQLPFELIDFL